MEARITSLLAAKVADALRRIGVRRGEMILLGISGGPDSVALLHALTALSPRLGYRLAAGHLNHRLRGEESDRDEAFVRGLCARLGVELVAEPASGLWSEMANLEERAREARHAFLAAAAKRLGASYIALAHHAGDQAETVLLRLMRGAGAAGLKAMALVGPGMLIRPMLDLTRGEIISYLESIGAQWVSDSSNLSPAHLRNRIRRELIPLLESEYAPGLGGRLVELAGEMRELDDLVETLSRRELELSMGPDGEFDLGRFETLHPALRNAVLRAWVASVVGDLRGVGRAHIEALRRLCQQGPPNGRCDLPGGWQARRQYLTLRLVPTGSEESRCHGRPFCVPLALRGSTEVAAAGLSFDASIIAAGDAVLPRGHMEALFDADEVGMAPVARSFIPGDRIRPLGLKGSRKVKDVFIEHKIPPARRATFPIVTVEGEVAWLPGLKRGRIALIGEKTTRVLCLFATPLTALH